MPLHPAADAARVGSPAPAAPCTRPHPLRRAERAIADEEELRALVDACPTVRIGAVDAEGLFVVPMSFGYDWRGSREADGRAHAARTAAWNAAAPSDTAACAAEEPRLTLWVHSATTGRKAAAFDASPQIAIEMDVQDGVISGTAPCAYSYAYRSIMGTGRISRVDEDAGKRHGLARIMAHLAPETHTAPEAFPDAVVARTNVYRIDVERFTGKRNARAPR